ncbi:MAG: hypothetical protein K6U87_13775 [Firmicutes bacterium]|nr:hypothetical protein [Bacillota bacterium]
MSGQIHPVVQALRERAFAQEVAVVLSDGEDPRAQAAASQLVSRGQIVPVLVGDEQRIREGLAAQAVEPARRGRIEVYDPKRDPRQAALLAVATSCERLCQAAEAQGMSLPEVAENPVVCAALMVRAGWVAGMVGGSAVPTAEVIRAGIRVVGLHPERPLVTGTFAMLLRQPLAAGQTVLMFADAAVIPHPTPEQLGLIALNAAAIGRKVVGLEPKVALLSFSTKGSAQDPAVERVQAAVSWLKSHAPSLAVDGELQADAALVPEVGRLKAPGSSVAGWANVLVFPNLESANIAYKLVERLAGATALGVILSGFAKPVHDLSRGCSADDIVNMAAVTALQATEG